MQGREERTSRYLLMPYPEGVTTHVFVFTMRIQAAKFEVVIARREEVGSDGVNDSIVQGWIPSQIVLPRDFAAIAGLSDCAKGLIVQIIRDSALQFHHFRLTRYGNPLHPFI